MEQLKKITKKIDKDNPGKSLKALELSGDVNSNGGITVMDAIYEVSGYRVEYYQFDSNNVKGNYVLVGLTTGKSDKTIVITESGKLYLSK